MQAYGNGLYVSITSRGDISTSADNITWSSPVTPFASIDAHWSFVGISFANGIFVAFGNRIVIVGTALPDSEWLSTIVTGGIWSSAEYTGSNWVLRDNQGRMAVSASTYPADWKITKIS